MTFSDVAGAIHSNVTRSWYDFVKIGPQVENPYGEHCDSELAPEIITKTVASLPPEQMYELMKQMKLCVENNPHEARQMLLLNPQLSYALLQSMVVMRIVDPQTAVVRSVPAIFLFVNISVKVHVVYPCVVPPVFRLCCTKPIRCHRC